jgi:hypothetical protein
MPEGDTLRCMFGEPDAHPTFLRRLIANPGRLRRRGAAMLVVLALGFGVTSAFDLGFVGALLAAVCWIAGPLAALGMAIGEAFFLHYGRGMRRVVLTILTSAITALAACVAITLVMDAVTDASQLGVGRVIEMALYALLFAAVFFGLGATLALGIGRSGSYLADRIDVLSGDDW